MREADYEARRARLEREREAGLRFSEVLREKVDASRGLGIEDVFGTSQEDYEEPDDAA
jgi:hypothetical protein